MKNRRLNLLLVMVFSILAFCRVYSQPYDYGFQIHPYDRTLPQYEIDQKWFIFRVDLRSGRFDTLRTNVYGIAGLYTYNDQSKIVLAYMGGKYSGGRIRVADPSNLSSAGDSIFYEVGEPVFFIDAPKVNKFFIGFSHPFVEDSAYTRIFDRTTYQHLGISYDVAGGGGPFFLSSDQKSIYRFVNGPKAITFDVYSTSTYKKEGSITSGILSNDVLGPIQDDGANGKAIVSFEEQGDRNFETQKYGLCDVDKRRLLFVISFPWRSQASLSADGLKMFVEEVPWINNQIGGQKTGRFWIFSTETGQLLNKLSLTPGGYLLTFENYPNELFYYDPNKTQSTVISAATVIPTSVLLDTLIALTQQAYANGWLADKNFVKELDNHLENAQKHLAKGNSVHASKEIEKFREKVNKEYERTVDIQKKNKPRDKRFVTVDGWKLLYFNAQYIIDRLPSEKKGKKR